MPTATALTLMAPSGATKVFAPRSKDANGVVTLANTTGVPIGDLRLTVQRSRTQQGREKVSLKFVLPTIQTTTEGGVDMARVAKVAYADMTFSFDGASTTSERQLARYLVASVLGATAIGDTQIGDELIDNLDSLY